jgi:hypothetical protein
MRRGRSPDENGRIQAESTGYVTTTGVVFVGEAVLDMIT